MLLIHRITNALELLEGCSKYQLKMRIKGITPKFLQLVTDLQGELGKRFLAQQEPTAEQHDRAEQYIDFITKCHNESMDEIIEEDSQLEKYDKLILITRIIAVPIAIVLMVLAWLFY